MPKSNIITIRPIKQVLYETDIEKLMIQNGFFLLSSR